MARLFSDAAAEHIAAVAAGRRPSAIPRGPHHPNDYRVIFADVFSAAGHKLGHCATSGYHDHAWTFYPCDVPGRRVVRGIAENPLDILPKWARNAGARVVFDGEYGA